MSASYFYLAVQPLKRHDLRLRRSETRSSLPCGNWLKAIFSSSLKMLLPACRGHEKAQERQQGRIELLLVPKPHELKSCWGTSPTHAGLVVMPNVWDAYPP